MLYKQLYIPHPAFRAVDVTTPTSPIFALRDLQNNLSSKINLQSWAVVLNFQSIPGQHLSKQYKI